MDWFHVACLLFLTSGYFITRASAQSQETFILASLGDHGDRITDLETVIKTLKADYGNLVKSVTDLKLENQKLKSEIQNLTAVCQCCQSNHKDDKYQAGNNSSVSTTTALTSTITTPTSTVSTPHTSQMTSLPTTNNVTKTTSMSTVTSQNSTFDSTANTTQTTLAVAISTGRSTQVSNTTVSSTHVITNSTESSNGVTTNSSGSPTQAATTSSQSYTTSQTTTQKTIQTQTTTSPVVSSTQFAYEDCNRATGGTFNEGVFLIKVGTTGRTVRAYCATDGWLVIQRRSDGSQSFDQGWNTYKQGFGDPNGEFWLGNENIHQITSSGDYTLRIDIQDWASNHMYEMYQHFRLENEFNYYKLFVGSGSGTAGDSFHYPQSFQLTHFQMPFSTPDRDNDNSFMNCALELHSGWWFNDCYSSNLNGKYLSRPYGQHMLGETYGQPTMSGTGIEWYPFKKHQYSLKSVEMKIRLGAQTVHNMVG